MGYEFFGEKNIFASAPVPGINNDQSLTGFGKRLLLANWLPWQQRNVYL